MKIMLMILCINLGGFVAHEDNQTNPLTIARKEKNLSRADLAIKLGVAYASISAVELGHAKRLPLSWKDKLEAFEFPFEDLANRYDAWRSSIAGR